EMDGSSPPGVFVGRFGYPKVYVGPLVPPVHGDTQILDTPEAWIGHSMEDIVQFRSQLVRGMHRVHVQDVDGGGRIVERTRELALGTSPADVEVGFSRKPLGRVVLDDNIQPFGPSAPLRRLDVGTLKVDPNLDRAFSDTDLRAKEAVVDLYGRGTPVSKIQRAFSVGAFGLEKNRRFVPTRLAIAEGLAREQRQAATVILRETHPGYIMPVGVWNVREHVREALRRPPQRFPSMAATLAYLQTRLDIPMSRYIQTSEVLHYVLHQRTFDDFDFSRRGTVPAASP